MTKGIFSVYIPKQKGGDNMGVVLFCMFVFCSEFWDWMKKFK